MAQSKTQQNALRSMLLNNGNQPSAIRHIDKKASQAAAIAARRADIKLVPTVSYK